MPHEATREKRSKKLLIAVGLGAFVVRLVYLAQLLNAPFFDLRLGDAEAYHEWALRIAGGDWIGTDAFYQAPLYPYFLAGVYALFGNGAGIVRLVQAAIGAGSCVLLSAAGMALFGRWGATAGVLLAIYPTAIFFDGMMEKTALVGFFTAALLYLLAARHLKFRELFTGVALGLLALTRENAVLLVLPAAAWFIWGERHPLRRVAPALACGCALVLVPVAARNYAVGGEFHLTTSQFGPNFYIGNHAGTRGVYEPLVAGRGNAAAERDDATRLAEKAEGRQLSPREVSAYWTGRSLAFIREQPAAWLAQLARKLALTWNAVEIADTESAEVYAEWSPLLRLLSPFSFGVVLALAAAGAALTAAAWPRLWFLYTIAATYTASVVVFYLFARYRFPLVPVLLLLAAGGIAAVRERPRKAAQLRALAAAVAAAAVACLPLENTRMDRVSHYVTLGNFFLRYPEQWQQSEVFYAKALRESPRDPAAHYGIGMLLAAKQQSRDALPHYQIAVEGWRENADVHVNYALALADVGDIEGAFNELDSAARLRPIAPTPYLMVGNLMLKQSRPTDAAKAFARANEVQPGRSP